MTLLGEFSMGQSTPVEAASTMDMSLDDMIANRRTTDQKEKTAERSIATGRAKRQAAQNAKRGISNTSKASPQQIDKEVKKQQVKTAKTKAKKNATENKKGNTSKLPPQLKLEARRSQREINKLVKDATSLTKGTKAIAVVSVNGRAPSKKAVNAAVKAMEKEGFTLPEGMQMVITFAQKEATQRAIESAAARNQTGQQQQNKSNNNNQKSNNNNNKNNGQNRGRGRN